MPIRTSHPHRNSALTAPEIRIDQLTGLRVVLAPGRAERPDAFSPTIAESNPDAAEKCPFCEGREDRTPPEVWADRPGGGGADTPGWRVRSVPNLYPVLGGGSGDTDSGGFSSSADPLADSRRTAEVGLFGSQPADGSHEVIVNTPRHETSMAALSAEELEVAVEGGSKKESNQVRSYSLGDFTKQKVVR